MDALNDLLSHLCGQRHCLIIDGAPLPVCQRCLGLYGGAALTAAWLLASGLWRRGLPPAPVVLLNALLIIAALLGGLHILDFGPSWRVLCGTWTGHVVTFWLLAGAAQLRAASRPSGPPLVAWDRTSANRAIIAALIAGLFALAPMIASALGRPVFLTLIILGVLSLAGAILAATLATGAFLARRSRGSQAPDSQ